MAAARTLKGSSGDARVAKQLDLIELPRGPAERLPIRTKAPCQPLLLITLQTVPAHARRHCRGSQRLKHAMNAGRGSVKASGVTRHVRASCEVELQHDPPIYEPPITAPGCTSNAIVIATVSPGAGGLASSVQRLEHAMNAGRGSVSASGVTRHVLASCELE